MVIVPVGLMGFAPPVPPLFAVLFVCDGALVGVPVEIDGAANDTGAGVNVGTRVGVAANAAAVCAACASAVAVPAINSPGRAVGVGAAVGELHALINVANSAERASLYLDG